MEGISELDVEDYIKAEVVKRAISDVRLRAHSQEARRKYPDYSTI
jgi:hypothetical protein